MRSVLGEGASDCDHDVESESGREENSVFPINDLSQIGE